MRVLLFGRLSDIAGWRERAFDPAPSSLSALKALMAAADAALAEALAGPGVQAAVNGVLTRGDTALSAVAEVAFMPPDERRMIRLTDQPFDAGAELNAFCAGRTETGAVASFVGIARGEAGAATALELEAYLGFTEAQIAEIADTAIARWNLHDYAVVHRIGRIAPGETIVFVAAAAAHRREAFEACDHLMDYLKSRAPFWKKEHGPAGARWVEPTARDLADAERWDQTKESTSR